MERQQGSICGPFLWLSVCKAPRAQTHNTGGIYQGPPRSMGRMTFALCCRLGPWCHAIYPVAPLKGVEKKQGKVPHLPPTETQKRQDERHLLQTYPPETVFIPLQMHLGRLGSSLNFFYKCADKDGWLLSATVTTPGYCSVTVWKRVC